MDKKKTIDLWLSQAEQDDVLSPGFRQEVQRRMLEQQAEIERLREERDEARNIARQYFDPLASDGMVMGQQYPWLEGGE